MFNYDLVFKEDEEVRCEVERKLDQYEELLQEINRNSVLVDFSGRDFASESTLYYLEDVVDMAKELLKSIKEFKENQEEVLEDVYYQNKLAWA